MNMNEAQTLHLDHVLPARGAKIGMWLFLFTELLLFGGMFLIYAVYRFQFAEDFHNAATDLNIFMGTINTIILLTSSLTMALSIVAFEKGNKNATLIFLGVTILCGLLFMVNKYFEWMAKFHHGIYPGSELLEARAHGENLFYGLYFVMTGLHGLHVIVGMIVLFVLFTFIMKNPYEKVFLRSHSLAHIFGSRLCILGDNAKKLWQSDVINENFKEIRIQLFYTNNLANKMCERDLIKLENGGLYWHLVDIIWIFLFPLFYLIT